MRSKIVNLIPVPDISFLFQETDKLKMGDTAAMEATLEYESGSGKTGWNGV